jgi:hypothetical protein
MKISALIVGLAALCGAFVFQGPATAARAQLSATNTASESYYTLDVPQGTATARVDMVVQNTTSRDLSEIGLWAMPAAKNIVVKQCQNFEFKGCETALAFESEGLSDTIGLPTFVIATLAKPIKAGGKTSVVMTYEVPAQNSELVRFEAGAMEGLFISQGAGSFVYVDVPAAGENVFEPGCLKASDQPEGVREADLHRWICGDAILIALSAEDDSQQERCAGGDDRCRQRALESPFSAFAQSITDKSKQGVLQAEVPLGRGPVKVELRYFRRDQAWADAIFPVAIEVLPKLEALYGFQYPRDTIVMRESNFIGIIGAAGVAFPGKGQVLLSHHERDLGFDKEVLVHELAHQWAGNNLSRPWLWEGLAEWATQILAPQFGVTLRDWRWQSYGHTDPIGTWHEGSSVNNGYYWYGKSAAFWAEYEKAIGGREKMTAVLSLAAFVEGAPEFDGRWFMDRGEEVSGANLDELFLTWVWNRETAAPLLAERRVARDQMLALYTTAAAVGLDGIPSDIRDNLNIWAFGGMTESFARANKVITDYTAVVARAQELGYPPTDAVAKSWGVNQVSVTANLVADMRQTIDAVEAARVAFGDAPTAEQLKVIEDARAKYANGDLAGARKLASGASTRVINGESAEAMIAVAKDRQQRYKPSFFNRIGLLLQDPDADLAEAEQLYASGEYERAFDKANAAYETWNGAGRNGIMRLAMMLGAMCALCAGAWWLLRKLDLGQQDSGASGRKGGGHVLGEASERAASWREWENTKRKDPPAA